MTLTAAMSTNLIATPDNDDTAYYISLTIH